ncbi:MAG: DUF3365 domain-containing protein [Prolixibacteraceae bacterium]|jgi:hypothetical protein|nr:DUF3365 domain-containing protein [Prolixibacteraceae bacterium]MBT6765599.1 DUF3365 domain-containing protein [Prolixibacteraceae bacterium]MBT6997168.1 DUF3365 domain-containing protein [Prolixibacteraceae bacterium]MBT7396671.1 DUF3365 domain-containing protein [Prolixibacteraceae bacterium]
MKRSYFYLFAGIILLVSCNQNSSKIDLESYVEFQKKGTEISQIAQSTLLVNVGKAIQKGGPEHAVEFCNLQASSIVDSLNNANNCVISRVSIKNRNPENGLKDKQDKELWTLFQNNLLSDTLVHVKQKLVYYKPIKIGMPACLKCHGNPETEINSASSEKLKTLYPNDLAVGYKLNDFRGLWKIEFEIK